MSNDTFRESVTINKDDLIKLLDANILEISGVYARYRNIEFDPDGQMVGIPCDGLDASLSEWQRKQLDDLDDVIKEKGLNVKIYRETDLITDGALEYEADEECRRWGEWDFANAFDGMAKKLRFAAAHFHVDFDEYGEVVAKHKRLAEMQNALVMTEIKKFLGRMILELN